MFCRMESVSSDLNYVLRQRLKTSFQRNSVKTLSNVSLLPMVAGLGNKDSSTTTNAASNMKLGQISKSAYGW